MKRFFKTTAALFKKDFKDTARNANMGILLVLPPLFGVLFRFTSIINFGPSYILMLTTVMAMSMIPLNHLSSVIAEEKEKNTLRTLMLSGVSAAEFVTSKILVVWILMQLVNIVDFFIAGYPLAKLPMFLFITTLGSVSLLGLGAAVGIISRDQMSTSVVAVPIMMLLLLPTTMKMLSPVFETMAQFSPIDWMLRLFSMWEDGQSLFSAEGAQGFLVIGVWTLLGIGAYWLAYRKKRLDA